jgi:hypothetical protein
VVEDFLAKYGNLADKIIIAGGRLNMEERV